MITRRILPIAILVVSSIALAGEKSHPYRDHVKRHPRQNEVNKRLDNQTNRAERQEKNGKLTDQQAETIEKQDQKIYQQEQADKRANGGNFITKRQQAQLNKEENAVNREDRRFMRQDEKKEGAPAPAGTGGN